MSSIDLKGIVDNSFVPALAQEDFYQSIDRYAAGTGVLYSSGKPLNNNDISMQGSGNAFSNQYDLDQGWSLQERFDFSGHNSLGPHLKKEVY